MTFNCPAARPILITTAFMGLLSACAPDGGNAGQSAGKPDGAALFATNCSACHGKMGRGPSLDSIRALSPDGLRSAIRNHPRAGQIPQRLPAAELQRLIEFLEQE
ncbi:MAG: cytochrome c [Gammaproteobacteria bacterium]|nr:cytochrome c [Gammaproteobacteria bacterium]MBT8443450.1 cytochrome c [Gammaproteobacteria bacterium]NND37355.1 cytochrome c [Gammaproteobacteria bacterium]